MRTFNRKVELALRADTFSMSSTNTNNAAPGVSAHARTMQAWPCQNTMSPDPTSKPPHRALAATCADEAPRAAPMDMLGVCFPSKAAAGVVFSNWRNCSRSTLAPTDASKVVVFFTTPPA